MKKSRLLEIIREEIAGALKEETIDVPNPAGMNSKQKEMAIKTARTSTKDMTLGTPKNPIEFVEGKVKKLAEKYQLDEDTINEMASVVQTKKALEKLGDEDGLELVKDVEKETLEQFKNSNPSMTSDKRLIRKLEPEEITGKRDTRGYGADFERNFKKKAGMDFLDFTTQIDIELKNKFPEEKFTPGLATNTTEKDAAAQIFNLEKGKQGRKADPNKPAKEKPESTGKKGRPAGEPKTRVATRTKGDDGFDTVSYVDKEEAKAAAAAEKADKALGGKYAANLSSEDESNYESYKSDITSLVNDLENKYDKSKMEELKLYLEDSEVRRLFKAKGVKLSDLVRSVIK
jgi:hypothetical protein